MESQQVLDELKLMLDLVSDWEPILRVIHEAISTDKLGPAVIAIKEQAEDGAAKSSRTYLRDIAEVAFKEQSKKLIAAIQEQGAVQAKALNVLSEAIHHERVIATLQPHSEFLRRLENERVSEKELIADYAVKTFFKDVVRCFIQASSLAIHLGRRIANQHAYGTLIYTNSAALPITILREKCGEVVYAFCGPEYDPACAAWLFRRSNTETRTELMHLFTRDRDRLDTAFLMPIRLDSEGGLYYEKDESSYLVELLVGQATKIVVLATADRFIDLPQASSPAYHKTDLLFEGKDVHIVVASDSTSGAQPNLAIKLSKKGATVHIGHPKGSEWRVTRGDKT